ncbi:hypothetical protein [Rhizobium sp. Leaf311]|uniref:terminase small subunit-like protein n=1 Tax=Rhizobium sp. Leaf311 TaxID=1736332 RepID=UPI0007894D23|nr:hypothetical protein [Rhizobium sp. Leaf311]
MGKVGRPPEYSDEDKSGLIKRICGLIIQSSVEKACAEVGIAESTFYVWVAADEQLAEEYARARLAVSYAGEAELERITKMAPAGECDPKAANVASQNARWLMGRRNPKVYGDSSTVDLTSKGEKLPVAAAAQIAPERFGGSHEAVQGKPLMVGQP